MGAIRLGRRAPGGDAYDDRATLADVPTLASLAARSRGSSRVVDHGSGVIVVMTSHGARLDRAWLALESIAAGAVRPARLVLALDAADAARRPASIARLERRGLEVLVAEPGLGVHAKWHAIALEHPGSPVVTSDDDVRYPRSWLRDLLRVHAAHPDDVVAHRAHRMTLDEHGIAPYLTWPPCASREGSALHFGTSVSGQLLPPAVLERALADAASLDDAPTTDDAWLHRAALRSGTVVRQIAESPAHFPFVPGTQHDGLYRGNVHGGGNDRQVARLYDARDLEALRQATPRPAHAADERTPTGPAMRGEHRPWRRALDAALASSLPELDGIDGSTTPVIACMWRRIGRLPQLLADLDAQQDARITLVLWNNHRLTARTLRRIVRARPTGGALVDVRIVQRRDNIGGIARFVVARRLAAHGARGPVVTIDDDMRLGPTAVATLRDAWTPGSIVGEWAWRLDPVDYHVRDRVADGERADYVGTGGAAIDPAIADAAYFDLLPDRYAAIEDLWACGRATSLGWVLRRAAIDVEYVDDGRNQHLGLVQRKLEMWRVLAAIARGEPVAVPGDPTGGMSTVTAHETIAVAVRGVRRRVARLASRSRPPEHGAGPDQDAWHDSDAGLDSAATSGAEDVDTAPVVLAVWGSYPDNPWQEMLSAGVRDAGAEVLELDHGAPLEPLRERLAAGERIVLHLSWTVHLSQPGTEAQAESRVAAAIDDLLAFQEAGGRIVWTVHNVMPHETAHREAELRLQRALAEIADAVHVMHPRTAAAVAHLWTMPDRQLEVPHPSYLGVYPDAIDRDEARRRLGVPADARVLLAHGLLRPYKGIGDLARAFEIAAETDERLWLLVAGAHGPGFDAAELESLLAHPRATVHVGFVAEDDVQTWHRAADLAVMPYRAGLNSGALMLAATFGLGVIARPSEAASIDHGAGWVTIADEQGDGWLATALASHDDRAASARATAVALELRPAAVAAEFAAAILRLARG